MQCEIIWSTIRVGDNMGILGIIPSSCQRGNICPLPSTKLRIFLSIGVYI